MPGRDVIYIIRHAEKPVGKTHGVNHDSWRFTQLCQELLPGDKSHGIR